MATYFHGNTSEIQSSPGGEGLQTLYLMNPNYVPYSDAAQQPTPNMLFLNPNTTSTGAPTTPHHHANALNLASQTHAPPHHSPNNNPQHNHHHQQHLIGVAIPTSNILGSNNSDEISAFHGFTTPATTSRVPYNLWGSIIDQTPSSAAAAVTVAATQINNLGFATTNCTTAAAADIGFHKPNHRQGLSLTLSSQQPSYRSFSGEFEAQVHKISPASRDGDDGIVMGNGISSVRSVVLGSKYLKAAQELLDEAVNVGKGIFKGETLESVGNKEKMKGNNVFAESTSGIGDGGRGEKEAGGELCTAQRQELQMKKSKLVSMLDEVEQRYRHYHHQMQNVISSFEQVAGYGAAKSYTALALKTISKQFRCLKDAITSQIRATSKTLGEDDCLGAKAVGSGLRYVDHHLRQQRALQQLGMIQHNAWRPQRGLPERAVSILRAWLFEHFLHPYPKDSDKVMLAKQTGLTRSQVSNWFINARVRLWKPMVEEMYLEEVKEQDQNNGSHDNTNNIISKESNKELPKESSAIRFDPINVLQSKAETFNNPNSSSTEISNSNSISASSFHLVGSSELHHSPSCMEMKACETNGETNTKFGNLERNNKDGYPLMSSNENNGGGGYGSFSMEDIGRFNVTHEQLAPRFHGNGVSLTLGLPPSENLSLSGTQHGFLSQNNMHLGGRIEMGTNENEFCGINSTPPSSGNGGYESLDLQNRKRFASQLLRDFVA